MIDFHWKARVAQAVWVYSLIGETLARWGIAGISSRTQDCLKGIGKAPVIRLFLGVAGKIGVAPVTQMSWSLSEMGLIGKLGAVKLIRWSLIVRM